MVPRRIRSYNVFIEMVLIKIDPRKKNDVTKWCEDHIGPQRFYIHSKYGGRGWQFKRQHNNWMWDLEVEDVEKATIIMLKFG